MERSWKAHGLNHAYLGNTLKIPRYWYTFWFNYASGNLNFWHASWQYWWLFIEVILSLYDLVRNQWCRTNKDLLYINHYTIQHFGFLFCFFKNTLSEQWYRYVKIRKFIFLQMKTSEVKNTQIQSALDVLEGEGRVFTKQKNHVYGVMAYTYFTFIVLEILSMEFYDATFQGNFG